MPSVNSLRGVLHPAADMYADEQVVKQHGRADLQKTPEDFPRQQGWLRLLELQEYPFDQHEHQVGIDRWLIETKTPPESQHAEPPGTPAII